MIPLLTALSVTCGTGVNVLKRKSAVLVASAKGKRVRELPSHDDIYFAGEELFREHPSRKDISDTVDSYKLWNYTQIGIKFCYDRLFFSLGQSERDFIFARDDFLGRIVSQRELAADNFHIQALADAGLVGGVSPDHAALLLKARKTLKKLTYRDRLHRDHLTSVMEELLKDIQMTTNRHKSIAIKSVRGVNKEKTAEELLDTVATLTKVLKRFILMELEFYTAASGQKGSHAILASYDMLQTFTSMARRMIELAIRGCFPPEDPRRVSWARFEIVMRNTIAKKNRSRASRILQTSLFLEFAEIL